MGRIGNVQMIPTPPLKHDVLIRIDFLNNCAGNFCMRLRSRIGDYFCHIDIFRIEGFEQSMPVRQEFKVMIIGGISVAALVGRKKGTLAIDSVYNPIVKNTFRRRVLSKIREGIIRQRFKIFASSWNILVERKLSGIIKHSNKGISTVEKIHGAEKYIAGFGIHQSIGVYETRQGVEIGEVKQLLVIAGRGSLRSCSLFLFFLPDVKKYLVPFRFAHGGDPEMIGNRSDGIFIGAGEL